VGSGAASAREALTSRKRSRGERDTDFRVEWSIRQKISSTFRVKNKTPGSIDTMVDSSSTPHPHPDSPLAA
jgi:hypothetical protein